MKPRPGFRAFLDRCSLLPRRRYATAPASKQPLAGLRLAGGYRVGYSTTPEAAPLALSLLLSPSRQRRLLPLAGFVTCWPPPAPPASLAASSATSRLACSLRSIAPRPLRGKCSASLRIQHNSLLRKVGPVAAQAPLGGPTAARPAGSRKRCYVLRPLRVQLRYSALRGCLSSAAHPWLTLNRGAGLPRLTASSLAGYAGQSVSGCRPASADFCTTLFFCCWSGDFLCNFADSACCLVRSSATVRYRMRRRFAASIRVRGGEFCNPGVTPARKENGPPSREPLE